MADRIMNLVLSECTDENRWEAEHFIKHSFASAYSANLGVIMPRLMTLRNRRNDLLAAFGMRSAAEGKLFLETYLDEPIEQIISERTNRRTRRNQVVEIGNLAVATKGFVRSAILAATDFLNEQGCDWVAFTGTRKLLNSFRSLGLNPIRICKAIPERLDFDSRSQWGTYFDNEPGVAIGCVQDGYAAIHSKLASITDFNTSIAGNRCFKTSKRSSYRKGEQNADEDYEDCAHCDFVRSCLEGRSGRTGQ